MVVGKRNASTVPTQALFLLNHPSSRSINAAAERLKRATRPDCASVLAGPWPGAHGLKSANSPPNTSPELPTWPTFFRPRLRGVPLHRLACACLRGHSLLQRRVPDAYRSSRRIQKLRNLLCALCRPGPGILRHVTNSPPREYSTSGFKRFRNGIQIPDRGQNRAPFCPAGTSSSSSASISCAPASIASDSASRFESLCVAPHPK